MTIQQVAKQLNISPKELEKESLRIFLLAKLGNIEAKRLKILKRYNVESTQDWDNKLREGSAHEGEHEEMEDYFILDTLEAEKEDILKEIV